MAPRYQNQKKDVPGAIKLVAVIFLFAVAVVGVVGIIAGACYMMTPALRQIAETFETISRASRGAGLDNGYMGLGYLAILLIAIVGIFKMIIRR